MFRIQTLDIFTKSPNVLNKTPGNFVKRQKIFHKKKLSVFQIAFY